MKPVLFSLVCKNYNYLKVLLKTDAYINVHIYILVAFSGDRKMNRHVKLFPNHGPCEEPDDHPATVSASIKDDNSKKMSALSTMPIIPLARTQLEDLVCAVSISGFVFTAIIILK